MDTHQDTAMPTSEARILANQANALRSTGPKTPEGKQRSRANAMTHGLTGAGVVLPEADRAEVERRSAAFARETGAVGEIGLALARRAALNSVRMERGADQQSAALADRVRRAEADFEAPEGVDEAEADRLRAEAGRRAMFDPSPQATLARKYEAAAERGFFRALKELKQMARPAPASAPACDDRVAAEMMASFYAFQKEDAEMDALFAELKASRPRSPADAPRKPAGGGVDVPISAPPRR